MVAACPFPWPRGTPIRAHRMAESLGQRGHDVHVVTYHLGDAMRTRHVTVHRIAGPASYTHAAPGPTLTKLALLDPLLARKLRSELRGGDFDVIHAHHYEGLLCGLLARRRHSPPLVFDVHTLLESELPSYSAIGRSLMKRIGRALDRLLPAYADHVITVSEDMRRELERLGRVSRSQLSVISNGVEADHFCSDAAEPMRNVIAFAGNLAPYQGIDLLLRAFARVRQDVPAARLHLLTDGDFNPLRPLAEMLGIASSIEAMAVDYAALPQALRAAAVLVNPRPVCSGVPQKLFNYMASARPVVSFAASAALLEHEKTGLIVSNGDITAFAAAIVRLMRDPALADRLGKSARLLVSKHYSWDQVAARVEQVYSRVLARAPGV
ncbi:MAG: glycosyltransferase family 4 protein [Steroidobacteraceae bacterium]